MTVLVTGAGGFVGSAVVRRLVNGDERVVALLSPKGSAQRLESLPADGSWKIERADISDREELRGLLQRVRPRAIVHVALPEAAYRIVHPPDDDPIVAGPLRTLFAALGPDSCFLHAGSAWVLRAGNRLDESAPVEPLTPYARNKARADDLIPMLAESSRVPWINLRLFNMFGRYETPTRLLPTLISRLSRGNVAELTHGGQVRDFNDVDVVAGAFATALVAPDGAWNALYHVGSGRGTSVRELALRVAKTLGHPELVRFGGANTQDEDLPVLVADPSLAARALGWHPDLDLDERLRAVARWWLDRLEAEVIR